jgi:hypothetical protein
MRIGSCEYAIAIANLETAMILHNQSSFVIRAW